MNNLTPLEVKGIRVLTTKQIADCYETKVKVINNNFSRNKERYVLNKHYFYFEGDNLKKIRSNPQFEGELKHVSKALFWTEKGALLHAKSLNTDRAWEVYDYLVDFYFRAKENISAKSRKELPQKTEPAIQLPELSGEEMKRIGMNRGIVLGVYRAENQQAGQDIMGIYNRLSEQGKAMVWSLIFGEDRYV